MTMRLTTFLLLLICSNSFAQTSSYQNLLNTALKGHGSLFIYAKPIEVTQLKPKELWYYFQNSIAFSNQTLDTVMFSQIIQNAKSADTTLWSDSELPKFILINETSEMVSKNYVIQKLNLTNKKEIKSYTKYINNFNSAVVSDRVICYYSRPVFDNSKNFAIVQWNNGPIYHSGGGGIILYQLQNDNTWKEFATVLSSRY